MTKVVHCRDVGLDSGAWCCGTDGWQSPRTVQPTHSQTRAHEDHQAGIMLSQQDDHTQEAP